LRTLAGYGVMDAQALLREVATIISAVERISGGHHDRPT